MTQRQTTWTANSIIGPFSTLRLPQKLAHVSEIAGAGGGLVASIATCPLDVIKTKLQAQAAAHGHKDYLGVSGAHYYLIILE